MQSRMVDSVAKLKKSPEDWNKQVRECHASHGLARPQPSLSCCLERQTQPPAAKAVALAVARGPITA